MISSRGAFVAEFGAAVAALAIAQTGTPGQAPRTSPLGRDGDSNEHTVLVRIVHDAGNGSVGLAAGRKWARTRGR